MSQNISLESIQIASPCNADWGRMAGDERVRFCGTCRKNVYNLSEMSRADAEALLVEKEGKLCVQFYQRADGTVITDNCPVGLKLVCRPLKTVLTVVSAVVAWGLTMAGGKAETVKVLRGEPGPVRVRPTATPAPRRTQQPESKREVKK